MKLLKMMSVALLIAGLFSACQPEIPFGGTAADTSEDDRSLGESPFDSVLTSDNHMLIVRHGRIDLCENPDGVVSSEVEWNATTAGTEGTQVWLKERDKEAVLWSEAGAVSKSTTGHWLRDGTEIVLKNAENNRELARVEVTAVPCT